MDFHRELNNIKQRVAAAAYGRPTSQATPEDMFSDDLAALKMRLQSMEDSLNLLNASQSQREAQHVQPMAAPSAWNPSSQPSALPSGPLFWQLFTSLRADVRGLDSRVADVEQNLSDIEDRVDTLDPNRFTPSSSNATCKSVPWTPNQNLAFHQQTAELPYDYHQQQGNSAWVACKLPHQQPTEYTSTYYQGRIPEAQNWSETASGITFRDREITRLEDILNRMQSDLQDSEDLVHHKNGQIDQLNYRQEDLHSQITELQQTVRAYNNIFAMNRKEFESQQAESHGNKSQLLAAERQITDLRYALSQTASSYRTAVDEAEADKENELRKLRELADRNDDVVRQQGSVIARGATIIRERDETIERLSKELKISVDDCRNENRERERCFRLLEEKTVEAAGLKDALVQVNDVLAPPEGDLAISDVDFETPEEAPSLPITPVAFDAQQDHHQRSGQWTPQILGKYAKLPHEQRRAAAWKTGPIPLDKVKFGQAGQMEQQRPSAWETKPSIGAKFGHMSLRRSNSLKLLERLALAEEKHRTESPATVKSPKLRYKLPLDNFENHQQDACETPPALSPHLSKARNDDGAGHVEQTSRHQPVQSEKQRRSLQAYVESDDSREKRGDAALTGTH